VVFACQNKYYKRLQQRMDSPIGTRENVRQTRVPRRCDHITYSREGPRAIIVVLLYRTMYACEQGMCPDKPGRTATTIILIVIIYDRHFSNGVVYRLPSAMRATANQPLTPVDSTAKCVFSRGGPKRLSLVIFPNDLVTAYDVCQTKSTTREYNAASILYTIYGEGREPIIWHTRSCRHGGRISQNFSISLSNLLYLIYIFNKRLYMIYK